MTNETNAEALVSHFADRAGALLDLADRDYAYLLIPNSDYEGQLIAINELLQRHMVADQLLAEDIKVTEARARRSSGWKNERATDELISLLESSIFQDAAHSMAAVGMLAPLVESIFHQAFLETGAYYATQSMHLPSHPRWLEAGEDKWDCHFVWNKGKKTKNLVEGIFQLAAAVGLTPHLPENIEPRLKALFSYRNKMFHYGFEWPADQRSKFAKLIQSEKWPDFWFKAATSGGQPWIYYMTGTYVLDCISVTRQTIEGIGCFAKQLIGERPG
jgi:hypothetical protein